MPEPSGTPENRRDGFARRVSMAVALAVVALCSSSAETGGAMMFRYPGVNCISESVAADGVFDGTNPLNPAEYNGTAVENAMSLNPSGSPLDVQVEVLCPIPYLQKLKTQKFGYTDLGGADGLDYYEVQAYVDDNTMILSQDVKCVVIATDAELDSGVFDWEISGQLKTQSKQETVLRWSMLDSGPAASLFLTLHCVLPPVSGGLKSQIIGYGLKKARLGS